MFHNLSQSSLSTREKQCLSAIRITQLERFIRCKRSPVFPRHTRFYNILTALLQTSFYIRQISRAWEVPCNSNTQWIFQLNIQIRGRSKRCFHENPHLCGHLWQLAIFLLPVAPRLFSINVRFLPRDQLPFCTSSTETMPWPSLQFPSPKLFSVICLFSHSTNSHPQADGPATPQHCLETQKRHCTPLGLRAWFPCYGKSHAPRDHFSSLGLVQHYLHLLNVLPVQHTKASVARPAHPPNCTVVSFTRRLGNQGTTSQFPSPAATPSKTALVCPAAIVFVRLP